MHNNDAVFTEQIRGSIYTQKVLGGFFRFLLGRVGKHSGKTFRRSFLVTSQRNPYSRSFFFLSVWRCTEHYRASRALPLDVHWGFLSSKQSEHHSWHSLHMNLWTRVKHCESQVTSTHINLEFKSS